MGIYRLSWILVFLMYDIATIQCQTCSKGSYRQTIFGAVMCLPCPRGTTTPSSGSTSGDQCTCMAGYIGDMVGRECFACPAGTYKPQAGIGGSCTLCAPTTTSLEASTNIAQCVCDAGYEGDLNGVACKACPVGYAKSSLGRNLCTLCSTGFQPNTGGTSCMVCSGTRINPASCSCSPGLTGSNCIACANSFYKDFEGTGPCIACDGGSFGYGPSRSVSEDYCTFCSYGSTLPDRFRSSGTLQPAYDPTASDCVLCRSGTFKETIGTETCTSCGVLLGSATGTVRESDCACNEGVSGSTVSNCQYCAAGTYKDFVGFGECVLCDKGTYKANTGAGECLVCPQGTYKDVQGVGICNACPEFQTSAPGSTHVSQCVCSGGFF